MALFITCRKNWLDTVWAKEMIPLITEEAVRKKIAYYFFFSPDELSRYASVYENERSCILLLTEKGEAGMACMTKNVIETTISIVSIASNSRFTM